MTEIEIWLLGIALAMDCFTVSIAVGLTEKKFLPDLDVDVVENYIFQVFDKEEQHYLSSIKSEDIAPSAIYLPDGSIAREELKIKRITVVYATTDGYTIPEYDMNPNWRLPTGTLNEELLASQIAMMGNFPIVGYDEFIAGCKKVAETFPDTNCIKIHKLAVEDTNMGYLILTAEIDIYSTELGASRLSEITDPGQTILTWSGETNVNTTGGMIGMPLVNMNENNSFYLTGIALKKLSEFDDRPYASYFSNAILTMIAKNSLPLYEDYVNKVSTAATEYAFNADEATEIIDPTAEE